MIRARSSPLALRKVVVAGVVQLQLNQVLELHGGLHACPMAI